MKLQGMVEVTKGQHFWALPMKVKKGEQKTVWFVVKKQFTVLPFILSLVSFLSFDGCAPRSSGFLSHDTWPKKRVLVMPARNLTAMPSEGPIDSVSERISTALRKTGLFSIYDHDKTAQPPSIAPGEPIHQELLESTRARGINAVIFETINPVEATPVRTGIWPFRKNSWRYIVSMNVDIVDVNTGTITLSEDIAEPFTLASGDFEMRDGGPHDLAAKQRALQECLPDIIKRATKATHRSLSRLAWKSRIASIDNQEVIVNAGRDAGLRPGTVLEVFGNNNSMTSFNGHAYPLPGSKVGELRITSVRARHSIATPVKGNDFKTNQIVKVK